jgi:hypothetical protein
MPNACFGARCHLVYVEGAVDEYFDGELQGLFERYLA